LLRPSFISECGFGGVLNIRRAICSVVSSKSSFGAFAMSTRLTTAHRDFPEEMKIIGRLLTDYGDLEFSLMHCVTVVRDDLDTVLKCVFRARGETPRLNIADALGRQRYRELELGTQFETAIAAMRHCLKIRNQFAHAYWHGDVGKLCFVDLEELAVKHDKLLSLDYLTFHFIDIPLLTKHEAYFRYAEDLLTYANFQGRVVAGKLSSNPFGAPTQQMRPELYIL
jgi:hypothetical protein